MSDVKILIKRILVLGAIFLALSASPAVSEQRPLQGFYGGAYVSHSSLQSTVRFPEKKIRRAEQFNDIGGNTIYVGNRFGYANLLRDVIFIGTEVNFRYALEPYPTTILSAAGFHYELSTKWEASGLVRAGVVVHDRTAVYLAAGVSQSRLDIEVDRQNRDRNLSTPVVGVGFETMISPSLSLRGDWLADRTIMQDPLKITQVRWNAGLGISYWF